MTASTNTSGFGKILALGTLGAFYWFRRSKSKSAPSDMHSAAFADGGTHPENLSKTRSAGPSGMCDDVRRPWETVDQASDESFPASDPPSTC